MFQFSSLFTFVLFALLFFVGCNADVAGMISFANTYCDKTTYQNGIGRADNYGGDCAHFTIRSITAGGCIPSLEAIKNSDLWAFHGFVEGGLHYNLICVGGRPHKCWYNKEAVGGLYEFLRLHGWVEKLRNPLDFEAVEAGCAVMGNPKVRSRRGK